MMTSLFSLLLSFVGGVFDAPFQSNLGELWFYHPLDGTFKYKDCRVRGDWILDTKSFELQHLGVTCEDPRQWTFEQKIGNVVFDRGVHPEDPSIDALFFNSQLVGRILNQKQGFVVDFEDTWGDRHHLYVSQRVKENSEVEQRLDWFVSSSDYVSFDLQVW